MLRLWPCLWLRRDVVIVNVDMWDIRQRLRGTDGFTVTHWYTRRLAVSVYRLLESKSAQEPPSRRELPALTKQGGSSGVRRRRKRHKRRLRSKEIRKQGLHRVNGDGAWS